VLDSYDIKEVPLLIVVVKGNPSGSTEDGRLYVVFMPKVATKGDYI
jgi:hypothetical protein